MVERRTLRIPVGDVAPPGVETVAVRVVRAPGRSRPRPVVLCCFPGGGLSTRYYELAGHDMADHLAAEGFVLLLFDHPGTGDSDIPDDSWSLRPEVVADVDAVAARRAVDTLGLDNPLLLGVGHSMGAMLVAYQQARHRLFHGVALLGYSGRGLPEVLTDDELAVSHDPARVREAIVRLAQARFGRPLARGGADVSPMLVGSDLSAAGIHALRAASTSLLVLCGLTSMIPGSHRDVLDAIDVPVFLGIADHDIVGPPHEVPGHLPGAPDVTLHVVENAHHNSNVAPTRVRLWDRLATWATTVPFPAHRPTTV